MLERRTPVATRRLIMLGPAFVVATAFIDPGNVATNVVAGSEYGYLLVWVVVTACVVGAFVQYLAAKLGFATGRSLAAACRERYPRPVSYALWVIAELIIIMTDVAEFVGGALALYMLFGVPLIAGTVIIALSTIIVIALRVRGRHIFPAFAIALLFAVAASIGVLLFRVGLDWGGAARGLVPGFADGGSVLLAAGIVGATVMPHALFLHSTLAKPRAAGDEARSFIATTVRGVRRDVVAAMAVAGLVNVAILLVAVQIPAASGTTLPGAQDFLSAQHGSVFGVVFGTALLASALASACTGVYSGQTVMADFLGVRVNVWLRRVLTVLPSLVIVMLVSNPTQALVLSQVGLSVLLPFALIPLVHLTSDGALMGQLRNRLATTVLAGVVATLIIALNVVLLVV
ncbi:Nramp family divalent metal transporter [Epidermidibacterium keratini]|nr:Nramp family divalent metal transporter [Epidermidibacterium keratini]